MNFNSIPLEYLNLSKDIIKKLNENKIYYCKSFEPFIEEK